MSWASHHNESERLASAAHLKMRAGNASEAVSLFAEAAKEEHLALKALDRSKARTLGITAVSTVSLWYKARELQIAESVAIDSLALGTLPPFAIEQLRNLLQAIWVEQSAQAAGLSLLPGQVVVSVSGGQTITGGAPLDLIVDKVQTVQALFYRTLEFLKGLPLRRRGAPSHEIQTACQPWLLQAPPGSYQFGIAIKEPDQKDFFDSTDAAHVAERFLSILHASGHDPGGSLREIIPKDDYRATFLKLARNLAPTGKRFNRIEIRAANEIRGVLLGPEDRREMNRVLRPPRSDDTELGDEDVELTGVLRGLHLEKDWLEVTVDTQSIHIDGLPEAVDDTIGPLVNRRVIVQTKRDNKGRYRFIDIESDE